MHTHRPPWRKLLWIRQDGYPDNYTDETTFLDHLERNPRLRPYQFWPLVADLTVIVQHVSSVVVFVSCFVAIFQDRTSPYIIAGTGSAGTLLAWAAYELFPATFLGSASTSATSATATAADPSDRNVNVSTTHRRLVTVRSGILIVCALLGLSPILKSLTRSTTSDSIWALACWLMLINILFFDYAAFSPSKAGMPASLSLSTNAALMASTVLASRLADTIHVFLLILFSIEIFGIFPFFRAHLRAVSWRAHVALTVLLVVAAGAGMGLILTGPDFSLGGVLVGIAVSLFGTAAIMGTCSWWLIDLQKYKNDIQGPWDPARPVIRRRGE